MPDPVTPPAEGTPNPPAGTPPAVVPPVTPPVTPPAEGAPKDAPKSGELTLALPDGVEIDQEALAEFTTLAKEWGLETKRAQALVDLQLKIGKAAEARWEATTKQWAEDIKKDQEVGGSNYEATVAAVDRVMAKFGNDEVRAYFNQTKLGNYPPLVKMFAAVGRAMAEDKIDNPGASTAKPKTAEEAFYGTVDSGAPAAS